MHSIQYAHTWICTRIRSRFFFHLSSSSWNCVIVLLVCCWCRFDGIATGTAEIAAVFKLSYFYLGCIWNLMLQYVCACALCMYVVSAPVYLSIYIPLPHIIVCAFVYHENLDPNPIYAVYFHVYSTKEKSPYVSFLLFRHCCLALTVIDICGGWYESIPLEMMCFCVWNENKKRATESRAIH